MPVLPGRLGQTLAASNKQPSPFDDHCRISQRPRRTREHSRQRLQLAVHCRQATTRVQQLRQLPGNVNFLEIEIGEPPHFTFRLQGTTQMPLPNCRDGHAD